MGVVAFDVGDVQFFGKWTIESVMVNVLSAGVAIKEVLKLS